MITAEMAGLIAIPDAELVEIYEMAAKNGVTVQRVEKVRDIQRGQMYLSGHTFMFAAEELMEMPEERFAIVYGSISGYWQRRGRGWPLH